MMNAMSASGSNPEQDPIEKIFVALARGFAMSWATAVAGPLGAAVAMLIFSGDSNDSGGGDA